MTAFCGKNIKYADVIRNLNILDYEYYFRFTDMIMQGDHTAALLLFNEILEKGFSAQHFISGLSSHFRDLIVSRNSETVKLLEVPGSIAARYMEQAGKCTLPLLYDALSTTSAAEAGYRQSTNRRLHVEFMLIRLCRLGNGQKFTGTMTEGASEQIRPAQPAQQTQPVRTEQQKETAQAQPETAETKQPETAETKQPEQTVQQEQPAVPKRKSRFSLKSLTEQAEKNLKENSIPDTKVQEDETVTTERLHEVWLRMASMEKAPRLSSTLAQNKPVLSDNGHDVIFEVSNSLQKEWMENNCLIRLQNFLRNELHNTGINLMIEVKARSRTESKPYMPEEVARFMLKNNPELNELRKDLELEIK